MPDAAARRVKQPAMSPSPIRTRPHIVIRFTFASAPGSAAGYLKQARGPFAEWFKWLAAQPNLLANADLITMWGLTLVGLLLIRGLFTRLSSLGAIGFLLMFYFATPPFVGYFYSLPSEGNYLIVNKNLVELGALLVILVSGSGRFAGLDAIVHGLIGRRPKAVTAQV